MCGLAGIWYFNDDLVDDQQLWSMIDTLKYRGPDYQHIKIFNNIGFAHSRLSIIDLDARSNQPMTDRHNKYCLVFNGEIYNYQQLKNKYLRDACLKTESDTEVLLKLLIKKGKLILRELKGMFAFAFWNAQTKNLLLATDPFGKKPLFYTINENKFVFASEPKAILALNSAAHKLDSSTLPRYLAYEYIPSPDTAFDNIKLLPMGSLALVTNNHIKIHKWWTPPFKLSRTPKLIAADEKRLLVEFDNKLSQAVTRRLVADVPVGLLLSGGIDSSTIGWYMKNLSGKSPLSYSVSFPQVSFDETKHSFLAAEAIGTEHKNVLFDTHQFIICFDQITQLLDTPLGDSSLLPTYLVCQLAKKEVTVVLDGDGADELLGGYGNFQAALLAKHIPPMPQSFINMLMSCASLLPAKYDYFSLDFKLKSFIKGLPYKTDIRNQIWLGSFLPEEISQILSLPRQPEIINLFKDIIRYSKYTASLSITDAISFLAITHYMQNDILVKLDRASMYNSLESRTPFLDVDLAEFLISLPPDMKKNKYILRKLMQGRLPQPIIDRPKQGFAIPLGPWLRQCLYQWAQDILLNSHSKHKPCFNSNVVKQLLQEHQRGIADHRKKIWTLIMWQVWFNKFNSV